MGSAVFAGSPVSLPVFNCDAFLYYGMYNLQIIAFEGACLSRVWLVYDLQDCF